MVTLHDPKECAACANDLEQCHASLDCEARAWLNGWCHRHQPADHHKAEPVKED